MLIGGVIRLGATEAVQPTTGSSNTCITVGVTSGGVIVAVVMAGVVLIIVLRVKKHEKGSNL